MDKPAAVREANAKPGRRPAPQRALKRDWQLYLLLLIPVLYYIVFKYAPMFGNVIAFRNYRLGMSIFGEKWVGLKYFRLIFRDITFWNAFRNSLTLSLLNLIVNFPIPILFALLINEIKAKKVKTVIQTMSYLPRFISTVVVVGMVKEILSPSNGIVNAILSRWFGMEPIFFVNEAAWFRPIYIGSDIWQFTGWNAIIYLAALSNIDEQLYEAAMIDGAGRYKQTLHVTLPGIMPTITITLILSVGNMLSLGFEKVLLLYTPANSSASDILDTLVYRMGIENNNFSYATAIGLFTAVVGLILITSANFVSKKLNGIGLY